MAKSNITEIKEIIADKERIIIENIADKYLSDILGRVKGNADAVIFPINTEEVAAVMKFAWERSIPVTTRGAGTNLVGSTVPTEGGIILDLSRMNRILEIDEETFTATVEPGVVLEDFQRTVEERGLFYPPDPGEKSATIGGTISTNAGGMRAVKYGVTRDYVRGLELVLANGDILTAGSKNVKDASGLSLKNLVIGSEGTLAVITKCILKIIPKPEKSLSVLIPFEDVETGISNVLAILKDNINPTALEFVEKSVIKLGENYLDFSFPYPDAGAYIITTFDGHENEIEENVRRVRETVKENGALDFLPLYDKDTAERVWKLRGCLVKAVEAVSEQEPVDLVVPINKTDDFIEFVNKYERESGMQMVRFGHAGDGNVHLCMVRGNRSDEQWKKDLRINMDTVYNKAYSLGGLTSGEHGIGLSKRSYYLRQTEDVNLYVMRRIKKALDEKEILNNHKAYLA